MTIEKRDPSAEVPEEDLKDQLTSADPYDEEDTVRPMHSASSPVSESDWVEQQISVPVDDTDEPVE